MGVKLQDTLEKRGSGQFPLLNDVDLAGGFQVATSLSAIPSVNRKIGMYAYATNESKTYQLTTLPDTWVEVQAGATAVTPSVLVYKPGGTAGGNVYTSWSSLFTAFQAAKGPVVIAIDASAAPSPGTAIIPMGTGKVVQDFAGRAAIVGILYNGVPPILDIQGDGDNHVTIKDPARLDCITIKSSNAPGLEKLMEFSLEALSGGTIIGPTATLDKGVEAMNYYVTGDASVLHVYGTIKTYAGGFGVLFLSDDEASLDMYLYDMAYVEPNSIAGVSGSSTTVYIRSNKATCFHDQSGSAALFIDVSGAYDEVIFSSTESNPRNNIFNPDTVAIRHLPNGVKNIKVLGEFSYDGATYDNVRVYSPLRGISSLEILHHINGLSSVENIELKFNTDYEFSTVNSNDLVVKNSDIYAGSGVGQKGIKLATGCRLYLEGSSLGSGSGKPAITFDASTVTTYYVKIEDNSYCLADAFSKVGGETITVNVSKGDPGSGVDTQDSGLVPVITANVTYTGDIYGSDASTEVRKIYGVNLDSDSAPTPADLAVLVYDLDNTEYKATPFLQDYMLATADPTIAINPAKPLAEVGETIEDPTFAIVYTPGPAIAPALSYAHLADGGEGHDDNILSDPESPTMSYHYGPKTYGQTVTWTVTCRRGIGPVERTKATTTTWVNKVYYGVSDSPDYYDQVFIKALATNALTNTAYRSFSVNPTSNNHIYYAYRSATELTESNFWIGGFQGGFTNKTNPVYRCTAGTYAAGASGDEVDFNINGGGTVLVDFSTTAGNRAAYITTLNAALSTATAYDADPDIVVATDAKGRTVVAEVEAVRGDAGVKLGIAVGDFVKYVKTTNDTTGTDYDIWESNQEGLGSCTVTVQA